MEFYICRKCGKIVGIVEGKPVPTMCCGAAMEQLIPGTSDGAAEKHVPVVAVEGNLVKVSVSSVEHPMVEAHYIQWIAIETTQGAQRKVLTPDQKPYAEFLLTEGDELKAVYEYCNLHGLWKAEV